MLAIAPVPKREAKHGGKYSDDVLGQILSLCDAASLVKAIRRKACSLYNRVSRAGIVRGRPIDSVVSAVVLMACRQEDCQCKSCISFSSSCVGKHMCFVSRANAMKRLDLAGHRHHQDKGILPACLCSLSPLRNQRMLQACQFWACRTRFMFLQDTHCLRHADGYKEFYSNDQSQADSQWHNPLRVCSQSLLHWCMAILV